MQIVALRPDRGKQIPHTQGHDGPGHIASIPPPRHISSRIAGCYETCTLRSLDILNGWGAQATECQKPDQASHPVVSLPCEACTPSLYLKLGATREPAQNHTGQDRFRPPFSRDEPGRANGTGNWK